MPRGRDEPLDIDGTLITTGRSSEPELREARADDMLASLREPIPGFAAGAGTDETISGLADP